jgi:hypothetical protein
MPTVIADRSTAWSQPCTARSLRASTSLTSPTSSAGPPECRLMTRISIHGTTACRPAEHFATAEAPVLRSVPIDPYDLPQYGRPRYAVAITSKWPRRCNRCRAT